MSIHMEDQYNLKRFIDAQKDGVYEVALDEIRKGKKESHWMWFVFPQIDGLGISPTAKYYAIKNTNEAHEYINHPVLGERLREITMALLELPTSDATEVMGFVDDQKLHSCMTLFAAVSEYKVFPVALNKFFHGEYDSNTMQLITSELEQRGMYM